MSRIKEESEEEEQRGGREGKCLSSRLTLAESAASRERMVGEAEKKKEGGGGIDSGRDVELLNGI